MKTIICENKARTRLLSFTALALVAASGSSTARASVISANSDAYALGLSAEVANTLLNVNVTAPAGVIGAAPSPYNINQSIGQADIDLAANSASFGLLDVQLAALADSSIFSASAQSDVDGSAGNKSVSADATISNLGLDLFNTSLFSGPTEAALGLSASTIYSQAGVSGDHGTMAADAISYIENFSLNLFGLGEIDLVSLGLVADANGFIYADPNFTVLNVNGITGLDLVLNEQISTCSASQCNSEVNALKLRFDGVNIGGLGLDLGNFLDGTLDGEIILGHAYANLNAQVNAVPAPASVGLFGAVLLLLGCLRRPGR